MFLNCIKISLPDMDLLFLLISSSVCKDSWRQAGGAAADPQFSLGGSAHLPGISWLRH